MNAGYWYIIFLFVLSFIGLLLPSHTNTPDTHGYSTNIETDTIKNRNYRQVLYTSPTLQLVLMSLSPREEIGMERHSHISQFFRSEKGHGLAIINGHKYPLNDGDIVVIPPDVYHNIINVSDTEPLQLYTIYAPPQHPPGTIHSRKSDEPVEH